MNQLKQMVQGFVAYLHDYDYILFAIFTALFFLILILAIILRKKTGLSLLIILIAFIVLIAGPIMGYNYIHSTLLKTEITNLSIKRLEFSQALVIKGTLVNRGNQNYTQCSIDSKAYKGATNFIEELVHPLKPFKKMSIVKKEDINISQSVDFKMILEPFTYTKEYNISVKANCL